MNVVNRMKVGQRLAVAFTATAAVFTVALAIGWFKVGAVTADQRGFATTSSRAHAAAAAAYNMRVSQSQNVALQGRGRVRNDDGSDMHRGDVAVFEKALAELAASVHDDAGRAAVARIRGTYADWTAMDRRLEGWVAAGRRREAVALENGDGNALGDDLAGQLTDLGVREATAGARATDGSVSDVRLLMLLLGAFALVGAVVQGVLAGRSIVRPLRSVQEHMMSIARGGDLTARVDASRTDELGDLAHAFNALMATFHDIVRQVGETGRALLGTADDLTRTAGEAGRAVAEVAGTIVTVADASGDQAASAVRVTQQAEDMAVRVDTVAGGAERLADAAARADRTAGEGAATIADTEQVMERIRDSVARGAGVVESLGGKSADIDAIVATIAGIAEQTNLLALNAAVEAARAGEAGRSFAVVAEQVGALAESTRAQAGSIAGIVTDIQAETRRAVEAMEQGTREVAAGVARTAAAGAAFAAIRDEVRELTGEVAGVATAAGDLRAGTVVVRQGIERVATVSEQNAAASQEVSAASSQTAAGAERVEETAASLAGTARELVDLVSHYTVWRPGAPDQRGGRRSVEDHLRRRFTAS